MVNWKIKRKGIPLFLIVILLASGVAITAFSHIFSLGPTVQRAVTEKYTESFNVAGGYSFTRTKWLELSLPAPYDLTYKLTGDTGDYLKSESAAISLDLNDDGDATDSGESTKTISNLNGTVTFQDVAAGQISQKIKITSTAGNEVLVGINYQQGDQDPVCDTVDTSLQVDVELVKA